MLCVRVCVLIFFLLFTLLSLPIFFFSPVFFPLLTYLQFLFIYIFILPLPPSTLSIQQTSITYTGPPLPAPCTLLTGVPCYVMALPLA
jgi:hypothetical protein